MVIGEIFINQQSGTVEIVFPLSLPSRWFWRHSLGLCPVESELEGGLGLDGKTVGEV